MRWGYDVVGFLDADYGVSIAARNTISALRFSGRSVEELSVEPMLLRSGPAVLRGDALEGQQRRLTVFHLNPLDIAAVRKQWRSTLPQVAPRVCVPFWELPLVPRAWRPMLEAMDVVLAPTRFVREACLEVLPAERVLHYPQAVFPPAGVAPARTRWGLTPDATVFIVAFDPGSDIDRKNPWAAVRAFQAAFPRSVRGVQLVLKCKPTQIPQYRAQVAALLRQVEADDRVRVIERSLSYAEVLELYASCDVLLSLHRSEGLGLHLMEAMSLGKVVVATNWSGNAEFMGTTTSVPVDYRLVPVQTQHFAYCLEVNRAGQVWAEADLAQAVRALGELHAHPDRRIALGLAAARSMEERRTTMRSGETYAQLEALLEEGGARGSSLRRGMWSARRGALAMALTFQLRQLSARLRAPAR